MSPEEQKTILLEVRDNTRALMMSVGGNPATGDIGINERLKNHIEEDEKYFKKIDATNNKRDGVIWFISILWLVSSTIAIIYFSAIKKSEVIIQQQSNDLAGLCFFF